MTQRRTGERKAARALAAVGLFSLHMQGWAAAAQAQPAPSFSPRDIQVLTRALGFLQPAPSRDAWVGIVFAAGDPASRRDAEQVAALFGNSALRARSVPVEALDNGGDYAALIAAAGAPVEKVMAAAQTRHIACITAVYNQVESGRCTLWIRSEPRVEIAVSHAAAETCGLSLAAAFRMMIREL